ncbi:TRAP transporter large permease [Bacillaceae bacterium S4-13-56]
MTVIIPLLALLVFLAFGMPIAFAMGISGMFGLVMNGGFDVLFGILQTAPYESIKSFLFTTIPMFILMAHFMLESRITDDLFKSAQKWFGHMPGGLAIATVFAGTGMAAVSGSSTASTATMAVSAVPEMKKHGYSTELSMGVVSIAGTLAVMIPPSLALIMYGILTDTGVGELLIAGIIPGVITAVGYIVTIVIWAKIKPNSAPTVSSSSFIEKLKSLKTVWAMVIIISFVIVTIYAGVVTPTEAGAIGAFAAFIVSLLMRRLTVKSVLKALGDTLKSTTMILTIVICAMIFGYFISITGVTQDLVAYVVGLDVSKWVIVMILVIFYIVLGMFLDQMAILILTLPLSFPIIASLGFNPIWFGIIVTKTVEIGLVTPPVGLNVFIASGATGIKSSLGFKGVFWFLVTDLVILIILLMIPALSTWLPGKMISF